VHRSTEALDEGLVYLTALQRGKRGKINASAGLDVRDRESSERMTDDDRLRLWPDLAGIVERRSPDLLAGKVRSRNLMTAILELVGKPAEAPAAVPASVHEHEPCHQASIHHPMFCHS